MDATTKLVAAYAETGDIRFNDDLYTGQREALYQLFHGKCAYCEQHYSAQTHKGDVEHYRPKGSVRSAPGEVVYVTGPLPSDKKPHPGYYWLAYDWTNLFPSCPACNQRAGDYDGSVSGKSNFFPISGVYISDPKINLPKMLNAVEKPLLLNPRYDDPNKHLKFDIELGVVCPLSERGQCTIDMLGLNRDRLPEARRVLMTTTGAEFKALRKAIKAQKEEKVKRLMAAIDSVRRGSAEFSAFRRRKLDQLIESERAFVKVFDELSP